jgi:prepilin-type N-terminal cleavage/methylation domain-containing protein
MKSVQGVLREKGGFTLAELVVVLAIIGLLAGIAVPVYSKALGAAQQKTDETNAAMVESAVQVYVADTGVMPSISTTTNNTTAEFTAVVALLWKDGYLKEAAIMPQKKGNGFTYDKDKGTVAIVTDATA